MTADIFRGLILFTPGAEAYEAWLRATGDPGPEYELPSQGGRTSPA